MNAIYRCYWRSGRLSIPAQNPLSTLYMTPTTQEEVLFPTASSRTLSLPKLRFGAENRRMKGLAVLLLAAAVAYGAFHFYFQTMPTTDEGTAPTQAITLTGVRADLLQIATAERAFIALNSRCAALNELASSSDLPVPRAGRDGYGYTVECTGEQFSVSARHPAAPPGSSLRYPNLSVDDNMQVNEID